jgi:predicted MFS family arabinose efflux permease
VGVASYRAVLGRPGVPAVLLLGFLIRVPVFAAFIVVTLHVVTGLDRSYSEAGIVTTVTTVALAIAGPWRGRSLDRVGLRATIGPQLVVLAVVWSIAPFVPYAALLVLAAVGGLATIPTFSVIRQALISAVDDADRKAALSLDALVTELSFMVGPVLGVLVATWWDTGWALFGTQIVAVLGGLLLWFANPPLVPAMPPAAAEPTEPAVPAVTRTGPLWRSPAVLSVLASGAATTVVLTGTDLGVVAALREMGQPGSIGWVLAVWGFGSALGAFVYGALHRPIPVFALLALLAATTIPVALAADRLVLAVLLFFCGLFCAPTITASSDALSRAVPLTALGEAMGWQGVAFTVGSATGAPIAGLAIDHYGWQGAFVVTGVLALAVAVFGLAARAFYVGRPARTLEA